ncbi:MAG: MFS transporter [Caldilineaceae bacterium]|nr:MFS transporter [Caldilineaceae bacterium]
MPNLIASFRRLPRDVQLYAWASFVMGIGSFGIWAVLFNLYLQRLGMGPEAIGLLLGAGPFVGAIGSIPAAMIGARMGNRQAMNWGVILSIIAFVLLLSAGFLPAARQVGWLTLWWMVFALANSLNTINGAPWVMAVAAPAERASAFTAQMVLLSLGGFVGSLVAGSLPGIIAMLTGMDADSATAYWLTLWLTPITFAGGYYLLHITEPRPPVKLAATTHQSAGIPYLTLIFVGLLIFLQVSGESLVRPFYNLYLDSNVGMPLARIGVIFGIAQMLPIVLSLLTPALLTRWGATRAMIAMSFANALCFLAMAFLLAWLAASASYIVFMSIAPIANVVRTVFSQESVDPRWRTAVSTATNIGIVLSQALFTALGGFLIAGYGYRALFLAGAMMALITALVAWIYLRVDKRQKVFAATLVASVPTLESVPEEDR